MLHTQLLHVSIKHATLVKGPKTTETKWLLFIIFPLAQFQLHLGDSSVGIVRKNANFSGSETDFPQKKKNCPRGKEIGNMKKKKKKKEEKRKQWF